MIARVRGVIGGLDLVDVDREVALVDVDEDGPRAGVERCCWRWR